jgi:hypothetical protein
MPDATAADGHPPTVHGAAAIRRWRNIDKKLVALAAAEFQDLARPFVSGGDTAALYLGGDRRRPDDEDGDVPRHADCEPHARLEGVKRGRRIAAPNRGIAADTASGEQKRSEDNSDRGVHRRSRLMGRRIEIS